MCGLVLLLACGGEQSEVETTEEEVSENDESVEESEESEDSDEAAEEGPDELAVGVGDLALDEETNAQVAAPERRGLAHILVRYRGADRATSSVTRSKSDAETRANEALSRAREGDFGAVATEMSDDDANAESGGDMGALERGLLPEALDDALFSMEVGEVGGPIESPFGYHVIRRTR